MFRHLFKLIWNKKKQNALLISEMLISFMVIFGVFTLMVYYYKNYRKPLGFDFENVWTINFHISLQTNNTDSLQLFYEAVRKNIKSMPQVKEMSYTSNNMPFYQNTSQGSIGYNKKNAGSINQHLVEDSYLDVFNMKMIAGRWFGKQDAAAKRKPVVISAALKEELFGREDAIGKLVSEGQVEVIGVVNDTKDKGDYSNPGFALYYKIDTTTIHWMGNIAMRVSPDADAAFESRLYRTMANTMKNANIEIEHLVNKRRTINYFSVIPMIVLLIVACFLVINVALGLFGVLWYNINKRKGEIGLRRAIGASGKSVSVQLIGESMILATLSLIVGCFFAIQFPLMNVFDLPADIYITAIILSVLFMYLLVLICSWYPGRQAAAIYPAIALHED